MNGRALLTLAAVVWLLAPIAPPSAGAHAVLVRSIPSSRAALSLPPDRIQLWFSEPIEPAFSTLTV